MTDLCSRIYRGGAWYSSLWNLHSTGRFRLGPDLHDLVLGFRLIAEPKAPRGRVLRGGSWDNDPWSTRSAYSALLEPDGRFYVLGFRMIAEPKS